MKNFSQLSKEDRELALARSEFILVDNIVEGIIEIKFNDKFLEFDFKSILSNARKQDLSIVETGKLLMANKEIAVKLKKTALAIAEGSKWDNNIQPIMA